MKLRSAWVRTVSSALCGTVLLLVRPVGAQDDAPGTFHAVVAFDVTPGIKSVVLRFAVLSRNREGTAPTDQDRPIQYADVAVYHASTFEMMRANAGVFPPLIAGQTDEHGTYVVDARILEPGAYRAVARTEDETTTYAHHFIPPVKATLGSALVNRLAPSEAVVQDPTKDRAIERVFFATDRNRDDADGRIGYGTERNAGDALEFGVCDVSIPRDHLMARFESASVLRFEFAQQRGRDITLVGISRETQAAFIGDLHAAVLRSERRDVLLFVHGFSTSFEDAARRTAQLRYDLAFEGPAILYSWPSKPLPLKLPLPNAFAYAHDANAAAWSAAHLEAMLYDVVRVTGARRIHLIAHSMGNVVLTDALASLAKRGTGSVFDDVVLAAPDVDEGVLRHIAPELAAVAKQTTIYTSSHDNALRISSVVGGADRSGSSQTFGDIPLPLKVVTIDASAVDRSFDGHSYYGDNRSVVADLFYLLRGFQPPRTGMVRLSNGVFALH